MSETPSPKPFLLEVEDAVDPGLAPAVPEAEFDARAAETLVAVANANGRPLPAACNAAVCFENIARRYMGDSVPLARLEKM